MSNKIVMILVDGMRPDGMLASEHPFINELLPKSAYTLAGRTVIPSVTLPCHMSLFHSIDPARHGVTTNTYSPMAKPVDGLVEQLEAQGKKCAFFITWENLRDLSRPGKLCHTSYINIKKNTRSDKKITDLAIPYIQDERPDFSFVYLGETDEFGGHGSGWMTEPYIENIRVAWDCIEKIYKSLPEDYSMIILADHGGHDRTHGTESDEDMTIPIIMHGSVFTPGKINTGASIKDIAPTIAKALGVSPSPDWEGKALI